MTEAAPRPAFAPGSHSIAAYGQGAFAFAGMSHAGSILATPNGVRPIEATSVDDLDPAALAPLFAECAERPGSIEFLIVGTGERMAPIPKASRAALAQRRPALRSDGDRPGAARLQRHAIGRPPRRGGADRRAVTGRRPPGADPLGGRQSSIAPRSPAITPAISGSARSMRARAPATRSSPWRASTTRSVTRSSARAIPIWRRCGSPGGAKPSPANGRTKRPAIRSRSRFARRSTPMRCPAPGSRRCSTRACRRSRRRTISTSPLFAPSPTRARARGCGSRRASRPAGQDLDPADAHAPAGMALALTRLLRELPFKAGSAPTLIPADVAARHGASVADFDARRGNRRRHCRLRRTAALARDELAEAERRLKSSAPAILPAFIPLGPLRLDLDRLDRNADHPFDPAGEVSPLRRQWAIWRWARRF